LTVEDLTTAKIKGFSDEKIIGYIMNGVEDEGMPAFKGKLSEGEMRDVVKYIRVLQGKK
jgi:mono/diheme cytochrome c family protein